MHTQKADKLVRILSPNFLTFPLETEDILVRKSMFQEIKSRLSEDRNILIRGYWRRGKTVAMLNSIYELAKDEKVDCFFYTNSHTGMHTDEIVKLIPEEGRISISYLAGFDNYRPIEEIQKFLDSNKRTYLAIDEFAFYHRFHKQGQSN